MYYQRGVAARAFIFESEDNPLPLQQLVPHETRIIKALF